MLKFKKSSIAKIQRFNQHKTGLILIQYQTNHGIMYLPLCFFFQPETGCYGTVTISAIPQTQATWLRAMRCICTSPQTPPHYFRRKCLRLFESANLQRLTIPTKNRTNTTVSKSNSEMARLAIHEACNGICDEACHRCASRVT